MKAFGRRRVLSVSNVFLLLLLVFILAVLNLRQFIASSDYSISWASHVESAPLLGKKLDHTDNDRQHLFSICLPRHVLNSREVKLYGNSKTSRKYYLTIGIPTVAREPGADYLTQTLNSLMESHHENTTLGGILIVIQLGDSEDTKRKIAAKKINNAYWKFIESGHIDIIQVPSSFYPTRTKLKKRFGDSELRVKWRSKQTADFSFLFCYCHGLSNYHLQLEDDVVASPDYFPKLKDFIAWYEAKEKWFTLDASVLGYIGKVYHNNDLKEIATFYYLFFDEMPVDWLEYTWREIKGQQFRFRFRAASLFQHIGLISSLANKKQLSKEPYFDVHSQKFLGNNPPARVLTNLRGQMETRIENAYEKGGGFFWGVCLEKAGCFVKIVFKDAIRVKRIAIETGANFAVNDTIHSGSLEIGTNLSGESGQDCQHYNSKTSLLFKGRLNEIFTDGTSMNCVQILIKMQKEWICIREINVWK